ncbi:centrosomal protein of 128 kDa isoform X3 [Clupea harengus]|uniref:Centrosomal protein of 128 kDa isoform X3 n=1 Tax=Clupea harengus TaxID=7950 RepID=A0A6P8GQA4_CLUHA|nr:centrosomal protein of 128 kDa isoform X3 [Clupea harengus]
MESSSESETFERARKHRSRGRETQRRRNVSHDKTDADVAISEKIDTLASTLQDTSHNLHRVDQMLGQYREHTDDQAEAMATLRDSLEESIQQLQGQRLRRAPASHSASFSTLHSSDLEDGSTSDGLRYCPTSPLKDYGSSETGSRRRSRSATVRFRDSGQTEDIHGLHQSLRDLRSDQLRMAGDINREIHRRNRSEVGTKRTLENLNGRLRASQKEDPVSLRVEQRLQEIEKGIHSERQAIPERQRPQLHKPSHFQQREGELEMARRKLEQSEGGRDALLQQVEDMRAQLLRTEKERVELKQQVARLFAQRNETSGQEEGRRDGGGVADRVKLEREAPDLRGQLDRISSLSDLEELKRVLERKDREKAQLSSQVESLSLDLEHREQRQRQMLGQLRQIQSRSEEGASERERAQAQLAESERRREELRARAQEAVRQWKSRCRRLEGELQELRGQAKQDPDKAQQEVKERENAQTQLRAVAMQAEGARRELAEVLGHLAQREEELRCGNLERQRLEREASEVRHASRALQEEAQRQSALQAEVATEREQARVLRTKLGRMKEECARLTEAQSAREEAHGQLLRKQQALKAELEDKAQALSRAEERWRGADGIATEMRGRLTQLETELPSILQAVGEHIHTACLSLSTDAHDKLKAISQSPGLQKDPHRWLAETKTKLQWLSEELRERGDGERRVRRHLQQSREQLKALRLGREQEQHSLLQRLSQQEHQLQQLTKDKRDLQERNCRKDEEMRSLQDKILDLEMSTRLALDHLESVPDKPKLMENFKDLEESQRQREAVEQRYSKYKEIVGDLQHRLEESKRKIQEYRGEKLDATSRSLHLAGLSSSLREHGSFLSSTLISSTALAPPRRLGSPELDSLISTVQQRGGV